MLFKAEQVNLFMVAIPITPDAFKNGGAIVKAMGHNPYFSFRQGNKLLIEISV
jgi:hypothetical protein